MMKTILRCPGLLFQFATLITISITAGLNCSSCADIRKVNILKNTVPDFGSNVTAMLDALKAYSNPQCKTAINGERVSGVDVRICSNNPTNSPKEYRCVYYDGQVIRTLTSDLGEVSESVEFTYRNCSLVDVNASGSCANGNVLLPDELLGGQRNISQNSVSIVFQGEKCVSDANGTFPSRFGDISKAAVKKSCVYIVVLFVFINSFV